jgi:pimeloyl-ACP methyl ester carboxylesterase
MAHAVNGGARIHYRVVGAGAPLVLQHGLSDSIESWHEYGYVDGLERDRTLILIDARGHGQSDKPHDPDAYARTQLVADVVAVLDDLGIGRAAFYGHSMGGHIGFDVARYAPTRLTALIVSGADPLSRSSERTARFISLLRQGADAFAGAWEDLAPISAALKQRILANDLEALIALETKVAEELDKHDDVAVPAGTRQLLLVGQEDWNSEGMSTYARSLPVGSLVVLDGLNHLESFQRSDLTLPHVRAFLAAAEPSGRSDRSGQADSR